jgi:hypothetical protein
MFFSKACQHGTTNESVCRNLKYVSIKFAQVDLQKCINWPKKFGKPRQDWNKGKVGIWPRKLKTLVKIT